MITFKLNGKEVQGEEGQYILQVAEKYGVEIPTLCHHKALDPAGMCRLCTVMVSKGSWSRFVTACNYPIWEGMEVETDTEEIHEGRKLIVELLLARCPDVSVIKELAAQYNIEEPRFKKEDDTCILCGLCVRICEKMGNSAISLTGRGVDMKVETPFHVQTEVCMGCGACVSVCPTDHIKLEDITKHAVKPIPSEYDAGLANRKPIYVPYAQAIPNTPVIDRTQCVHFKTGGCKICSEFCDVGAIDYSQEDETIELNVGSIILAPGFQPFDPSKFENYNYANHPNVITSTEFERILSATGPFMGHLSRISDKKEPRKIAWFQCIGSRDLNKCDNPYCSSVCCMYAVKEAVIAKEHADYDLDCAIFFMDMRTPGKDFEKYYNDAKDKHGVRFIRSRVHTIDPVRGTDDLEVRYATESGEVKNEIFDMIVLSVGMEISPETIDLANNLGIDLTEGNFCETTDFQPFATSKDGIFVCGAFQGPKDIPESVMEASAAACGAGINLAPARGSLVKEKEFPDESDVTGEEPRIGVFVCNCGINIGGFADVPAIAEYARGLPNVVYVEENLFTCSQDTQDKMVEVIREQSLNRIVVAACTPRTHEPLFQETIRNAGLNAYLFDMANIRNQCTWVHSDDKVNATEKSKDLMRMAVARASLLEQIPDVLVDVNQSALVIGGGVAGMTAALSLADQGFPATIVEKSSLLGGAARDLTRTWNGQDIQEYLSELVDKVEQHSDIDVLLNAEVVGASGFVGNFETQVAIGNETKTTVEHGIVIVATGGKAVDTDEYLFGKNPRVTRWHELEHDPEKLKNAEIIVFIQCVGSRDEKRPYCSRICCTASILQAISIKENNPDTNVFILYRDIRTYGEKEYLYKKAREMGVVFVRYSLDNKPIVTEAGDGLEVSVFDPILQKNLKIKADYVNLATAIEPAENAAISEFYKIPLNTENFFMEAHAKLRPVEFANDGIFLCGLAHYPKAIEESISQAMAAASKATTILAKGSVQISPLVSQVDAEKCIGCGLCEEICPFNAIVLEEIEGKGYRAKNISASCKGCGLCASSCPQQAIDMLHFRDQQIVASVCAAV
ncbi:MAG: FAD-dependent oxidoreductase [Thermodesulfobacteriota bacterium]|nr:FAD-dependent oxidoreductase [Thermodesulfobacteriota bacterium]